MLGRRAYANLVADARLLVKLDDGSRWQGSMRSDAMVQQHLRTPTGPFFARFFIGIIPGLVTAFAFMRPSTRLIMSSFAARWVSREQNVGWKFRHGCSTGRHALTPSL
jgi:hypothetical protein